MKIYQAYSLIIQENLSRDNYQVLFQGEEILNRHLRPLIQEYLDISIPNNMRDKQIEINLDLSRMLFSQLNVKSPETVSQIGFRIPLTYQEMVFSSNQTFYHCLLALLSPIDLVNIIKAILLEKTLVFVGKENETTAFIFGLN